MKETKVYTVEFKLRNPKEKSCDQEVYIWKNPPEVLFDAGGIIRSPFSVQKNPYQRKVRIAADTSLDAWKLVEMNLTKEGVKKEDILKFEVSECLDSIWIAENKGSDGI